MGSAELRDRQNRLLHRSAGLRAQARAQLQQLQPAFSLGDRVLGVGLWLRRNPLYLAGGLLLLVAFKPRTSLRALGRMWSVWRSWQGARRWIAQAR
jgi:hypothetical protein